MAVPQLLNDVVNVLLLLAPSAASLCLVLAGISLRREGGGISFLIGGGFTKWMFWAVVLLTLQPRPVPGCTAAIDRDAGDE